MNKTAIRKSGLISAMLVAMVCVVVVPAVSADTKTATSGSYFGEGVGAGVAGTYIGGYYYYCAWHVGRWQGSCESIVGDLYFTLYADGAPMSDSTSENTYDTYYGGPLATLGASGYSAFYDSRHPYGYFGWSSGLAMLP